MVRIGAAFVFASNSYFQSFFLCAIESIKGNLEKGRGRLRERGNITSMVCYNHQRISRSFSFFVVVPTGVITEPGECFEK